MAILPRATTRPSDPWIYPIIAGATSDNMAENENPAGNVRKHKKQARGRKAALQKRIFDVQEKSETLMVRVL
jgi:hypothetical protein